MMTTSLSEYLATVRAAIAGTADPLAVEVAFGDLDGQDKATVCSFFTFTFVDIPFYKHLMVLQ